MADLHPGDAPEGMAVHEVAEDDAWVEGRSLIATVEDVELIDPSLSSERLLYRLFHERGVRVFRSVAGRRRKCSCSRDGVEAMLRNFSQDDRDHMVENGAISVTCEFCSANYRFAPDDVRPNRPVSRSTAVSMRFVAPQPIAAHSIEGALALHAVERERRDLDVEAFAARPTPCRRFRS